MRRPEMAENQQGAAFERILFMNNEWEKVDIIEKQCPGFEEDYKGGTIRCYNLAGKTCQALTFIMRA